MCLIFIYLFWRRLPAMRVMYLRLMRKRIQLSRLTSLPFLLCLEPRLRILSLAKRTSVLVPLAASLQGFTRLFRLGHEDLELCEFSLIEKSCMSIPFAGNQSFICQRKSIHYFSFFHKESVLYQTIMEQWQYEKSE